MNTSLANFIRLSSIIPTAANRAMRASTLVVTVVSLWLVSSGITAASSLDAVAKSDSGPQVAKTIEPKSGAQSEASSLEVKNSVSRVGKDAYSAPDTLEQKLSDSLAVSNTPSVKEERSHSIAKALPAAGQSAFASRYGAVPEPDIGISYAQPQLPVSYAPALSPAPYQRAPAYYPAPVYAPAVPAYGAGPVNNGYRPSNYVPQTAGYGHAPISGYGTQVNAGINSAYGVSQLKGGGALRPVTPVPVKNPVYAGPVAPVGTSLRGESGYGEAPYAKPAISPIKPVYVERPATPVISATKPTYSAAYSTTPSYKPSPAPTPVYATTPAPPTYVSTAAPPVVSSYKPAAAVTTYKPVQVTAPVASYESSTPSYKETPVEDAKVPVYVPTSSVAPPPLPNLEYLPPKPSYASTPVPPVVSSTFAPAYFSTAAPIAPKRPPVPVYKPIAAPVYAPAAPSLPPVPFPENPVLPIRQPEPVRIPAPVQEIYVSSTPLPVPPPAPVQFVTVQPPLQYPTSTITPLPLPPRPVQPIQAGPAFAPAVVSHGGSGLVGKPVSLPVPLPAPVVSHGAHDLHGKHEGHAHAQPKGPGMPYSFAYEVKDDYAGNYFGHAEDADGYITKGSYYVNLPDGRLQKVTYVVDDWGYHPIVTYEGEAKYPQPVAYAPQY